MGRGPGQRSHPMDHRSRLVESLERHPSMRYRQLAPRRRRRHRPRWGRLTAVAVAGCSVAAAAVIVVDGPVRLAFTGVDEAQVLGKAEAESLLLELDPSGIGAADVEVTVNGTTVTVERVAGRLVAQPGASIRDGMN